MSACRDDIQAEDLPCAVQAGGRGGSAERQFRLGEALAYMANMRTFWMITVGLGEPSLCFLPCVLVPRSIQHSYITALAIHGPGALLWGSGVHCLSKAPCSTESSSSLTTHGPGHLRTAGLNLLTALGQSCLSQATWVLLKLRRSAQASA